MPIAEIYGGISAFKAMMDSAKALKDITDGTARNAAIIELQEKILSAQSAQTALVERVRELEEEVRSFKTWEAEKQRYQLEKLPPGVIVRTLKADMARGEPVHHICENCYQHGEASPLNATEEVNGVYHLSCNRCKAKMQVGHFVAPAIILSQGVEDYDPFKNY